MSQSSEYTGYSESESEISTLTSEVRNVLDTDNESQGYLTESHARGLRNVAEAIEIHKIDLSKKDAPETNTETVEPIDETAQEPQNVSRGALSKCRCTSCGLQSGTWAKCTSGGQPRNGPRSSISGRQH